MLRFSILILIGTSALFSLASGGPLTATFRLACSEDPRKNQTATVELWDLHKFGRDQFVTRMDDVIVDGKTEHTITGDADNSFFQPDLYYLKIIHKCHPECSTNAWSYFVFEDAFGEIAWTRMNKDGKGEALRYTSDHTEIPIDLSFGHHAYRWMFWSLPDRCE